ncbi:MAG: hypothetical protein JSW61_08620 [Candidatus Thorarchaeota archaeon]|nr:MAG: hypothetical protein JSW61_08620 [Candidatus Thorarchaeota archaeon]
MKSRFRAIVMIVSVIVLFQMAIMVQAAEPPGGGGGGQKWWYNYSPYPVGFRANSARLYTWPPHEESAASSRKTYVLPSTALASVNKDTGYIYVKVDSCAGYAWGLLGHAYYFWLAEPTYVEMTFNGILDAYIKSGGWFQKASIEVRFALVDFYDDTVYSVKTVFYREAWHGDRYEVDEIFTIGEKTVIFKIPRYKTVRLAVSLKGYISAGAGAVYRDSGTKYYAYLSVNSIAARWWQQPTYY